MVKHWNMCHSSCLLQ